MDKDVEVVVGKGSGKAPKVKQGRKQDNPLRSAGAQKLLEDDVYRSPDIVRSTTSALIDEGFLPSQQQLEEGFLSTDVYECLARLDKKDSATRLKALSDFLQIVSSRDVADVVNTRTFWARYYVSFLEDEDPRVRELASRCHQQFVALLKKEIVPILGRIIGPWWLSQFQMHASAAAASRVAFQTAFTEQKRPEVLRRYSKDILTLLRNRILPKSSLAEKVKGKGQDVSSLSDDQQGKVAEGLDALHGFIRDLSGEGVEEVYPSVKEMLDKAEFWKLVRLQSPKVRQSFFRLLSALWNRNEEGMKAYTLQTLTAVIGSLHDKDLRTASEVWELLLLVISQDPQWSTVHNAEKILLPKLLILLQKGGFGGAKVAFPSLIVLIDKLPNKKPETYDSLLDALVQGFSAEDVRAADIPVICQALSDCFRYIVKKEEAEVAMTLVDRHLLPLYVDAFFGSSNMLKGWDVVNGMLLSWIGREGREHQCASQTFGKLVEKLAYTDVEEVNVERTKLWWGKLVEGAARVRNSQDAHLDKYITADKSFQDLVFQLFRLTLRLVQQSQEEQNLQMLKTLLSDVRSDVIYDQLKSHLEDEPTAYSPQRLIVQSIPGLLDGSQLRLDIFSRLVCVCHSPDDVQQLFDMSWKTFPDRLRLLKQLEQDGGLSLVRRLVGEEQMADLLTLAESLLRSKRRDAMEDSQTLLTVLAQLQTSKGTSPSSNMMQQFLAKADKLDLMARLRLYGSVMSAGMEVPSLPALIVSALVDLAADQDTEEGQLVDVSQIFLPATDRLSSEWSKPQVVEKMRRGLKLKDSQDFLSRFALIANSLSGKGPIRREFAQLALNITDFDAVAEKVLTRTDIFVGRLTPLEMEEGTKLGHTFWDEEMGNAAVSCSFVLSLLHNEMTQTGFPKELNAFARCLLTVAAYNQLALTSPPLVYDEQLRLQAQAYHQKFQPALTDESHSMLLQTYPNDEWIPSFWTMVGQARFATGPIDDLTPLDLAVHYSAMSRDDKCSDYGAALRERLEDVLTTMELPTTIETINATTWSHIQLLRLVPTLLQERCLELSYSGPVLDKFGSVVIDWIACLQSPHFSLDNVKVLLLVQEALGGVAEIVRQADRLKDAGMLWLELNEFSFPRILASILDGLLRFAEQSEEYLTQRHPLVARLIASVCGLVQVFAAEAKGLLRPVWETMFKLEIGLPGRLSTLQSRPVEMVLAVTRLFAPLLLHRVAHFQLVSAHVMTHLIPFFPPTYRTDNVMAVVEIGQARDKAPKEPASVKPKEKEPEVEPLSPPPELLSVLQESADIVETMLDEVPLGEAFGSVVPQTDSYTYMLGYLMTWKTILAWISNESNEGKQAFAKYLESSGSYSQLLDNMTRLLPLHSDEPVRPQPSLATFVPSLSDMRVWAAEVYMAALQQMPMLARAWFSRKQGSVARDVDRYSARHVTPQLVRNELLAADIQARHVAFDHFKVSVRPTVAEITAEYRVEVWIAEIVIRIPKDYPLSSAAVSWGRTKGSASEAWDQWVIRLRGFLQRQNGSVMDGLLAWKSSVDKKFRDIQACAICLAIVEVKSAALPQMQCKTCKNKFHNACLYRWFEQQVDPTCPLCREKFF